MPTDTDDADAKPVANTTISAVAGVQIVTQPRVIRMFHVTEQELDALGTRSGGVQLALFGVVFGALLVSLVTLFTLTLNPKPFAAFVALAIVSGVLAVYFGVGALQEFSAAGRERDRIKARGPTP